MRAFGQADDNISTEDLLDRLRIGHLQFAELLQLYGPPVMESEQVHENEECNDVQLMLLVPTADNTRCAICLTNDVDETLYKLTCLCSASFHDECISTWFSTKDPQKRRPAATCIHCRQPLKTISRSRWDAIHNTAGAANANSGEASMAPAEAEASTQVETPTEVEAQAQVEAPAGSEGDVEETASLTQDQHQRSSEGDDGIDDLLASLTAFHLS